MDAIDRTELGSFLRRCRERIRPGDVGLEITGRRRTPGLRRQEVAQLAGMSIGYYIQLEQGRGPRPSAQIVEALARALRMSDDERGYASRLVGVQPRRPDWMRREVRPGILHVLDQLTDAPALVCDAVFDALAWNRMAAALLPDFLAPSATDRNVIWRHFADDGGTERIDPVDRARFGRELVAQLRVAAARYRSDPAVTGLVERLQQHSEEFRTLWEAQDVGSSHSTIKRIDHPAVGPLTLDCEALHDPDRDQWMIIYTARPGTPDRDALRLLGVVGTQQLTE
ncbi:helix-turn-helix transcriptional regulator [Microlunatus soli]|uniref:helix-turn-helix transcriptional regulator n=1 Tax=Microlunatus soli TaxID=630515 RepID=UPI000B88B54D|nr:helix-turn-helix transcriptional regulator [Microlunatus soli]